MRVLRYTAFGWAVFSCASMALGQGGEYLPQYSTGQAQVRPAAARTVGYGYEPACEVPCEPACQAPCEPACGCDTGCDLGCDTGCGSCGCCDPCDHGDPWSLFGTSQCYPNLSVGGWLSAGYYDNGHGARRNDPLGFRDQPGSFDQAWIYAEKALDTEKCCWDWGFRIDAMWGADGPDTQAFGDQGWDFGWNSSNDDVYGAAIPQLYVQVGTENFNVKVGHFYTIIGYEVVQAPDNFFYSHAYTMYYGEPFTHTGALAEYNYSDDVTVYGGWTMGWDSGFENRLDASTFLGGLGLQLTDNTTLTWAVTFGDLGQSLTTPPPPRADLGQVYLNSFVLSHTINDSWEYVFQHDYGINHDIAGAEDIHWYGINQYLFYEINGCWKLGGRFEWFDDQDGARVGNGDGDYYAVTLGANYRPHANVVFRPEVRYDWFDGAGGQPFNNGQDDESFFYGIDGILTF